MSKYSDLEIAILKTLRSSSILLSTSYYRPEGLRNDVVKAYPDVPCEEKDFLQTVKILAIEDLLDAFRQEDGSLKIEGISCYGLRVLREIDSEE